MSSHLGYTGEDVDMSDTLNHKVKINTHFIYFGAMMCCVHKSITMGDENSTKQPNTVVVGRNPKVQGLDMKTG